MSGSKTSCGCQGAPSDPYQDSLEVVWHDPTKYDPTKHAPPYMPPKLASSRRASVQTLVHTLISPKVAQSLVLKVPLASLLSVLQAAAFLHKTHHWQTFGGQAYADHLLFDRLYSESQTFIDQVAERSVGSSGISAVDPKAQIQNVSRVVALLEGEPTPDAMLQTSLRVEALVLAVVSEVRKALEGSGTLTNGIDNLLQGVADLHETFVYLLKQRLTPTTYSYGR